MKIKICGITHEKDACVAIDHGADYIGLVFALQSKRCISITQAQILTAMISPSKSIPVAVFNEQDANTITEICAQTGITTIQLHGKISKESLKELPKHLTIIFAIGVDPTGNILENLPDTDYLLFDLPHGGTGKTFDWDNFQPPKNRKWILAGGLNHENVVDGIKRFKPDGVDVSSGVEIPGTNRKDTILLNKFINIVRTNVKDK